MLDLDDFEDCDLSPRLRPHQVDDQPAALADKDGEEISTSFGQGAHVKRAGLEDVPLVQAGAKLLDAPAVHVHSLRRQPSVKAWVCLEAVKGTAQLEVDLHRGECNPDIFKY